MWNSFIRVGSKVKLTKKKVKNNKTLLFSQRRNGKRLEKRNVRNITPYCFYRSVSITHLSHTQRLSFLILSALALTVAMCPCTKALAIRPPCGLTSTLNHSAFYLDRLTLFSKRSWRLRPCLTQFSITLCSLYTLQSSNRNILNTLNPANGLRGKVKHVCHIVWMTRVQHQTLHKWWPSAFKRTVCSLCWTSSLCKCHISNALWLE